jgi:L-alanine-DL-glutamate epimerase-like enolase superfamily enzyme
MKVTAIERRAARSLMPDVCRANGFSETLRIAQLAAAHAVQVAPHVVHELSVRVAAAIGNCFLVEYMDWAPPDLFEGLPALVDGCVALSARPGHGLALAPDAITRYRARP